MKKSALLVCLFLMFIFIPGCGCNNAQPISEEEETEIQHEFNGPTEPPYSVGPSGPPPSDQTDEETESAMSYFDKKARDSARILQIENIKQALEEYNLENELYPEAQGCIEDGELLGEELNKYFADELAADPAGKRENLEHDPGQCISEGKYYYKYLGDINLGNYLIMTVMELPENNNVVSGDLDYKEISKRSGLGQCPEDECDYYVYIN